MPTYLNFNKLFLKVPYKIKFYKSKSIYNKFLNMKFIEESYSTRQFHFRKKKWKLSEPLSLPRELAPSVTIFTQFIFNKEVFGFLSKSLRLSKAKFFIQKYNFPMP